MRKAAWKGQTLPGGKYAVIAVADIPPVAWLVTSLVAQHWLPASGYALDPSRPYLERFLHSPASDPYGRIVMDWHLPIRPRREVAR